MQNPTDIVPQLRDVRMRKNIAGLRFRAADEIERLRSSAGYNLLADTLVKRDAEIERLLERVAELQAECGYTESIKTVEIERLRAALEDERAAHWVCVEMRDAAVAALAAAQALTGREGRE
jgi:hypothetical protein